MLSLASCLVLKSTYLDFLGDSKEEVICILLSAKMHCLKNASFGMYIVHLEYEIMVHVLYSKWSEVNKKCLKTA